MRKGFAKTTLLLGICGLISKMMGLLREVVLASLFGATQNMDAFSVADLMANILGNLVLTGMGIAVIPVYSAILARQDPAEGENFASNALSILLAVFLAAGTVCMIYTDAIIAIGAPGLPPEGHILAVKLTRIIIPGLIFSVFYTFMVAIQHCHSQFLYPALAGIPSNLVLIVVTSLLADKYGIQAAAIANTAAVAAQAAIQWPGIRHCLRRWRFTLWPLHPGVRQAGKLLVPLLLGSMTSQISLFIERMLASLLPTGAIAAMMYAGKLNTAFNAICLVPILTVIFPALAKNIGEGCLEDFKNNLQKAMRAVCFITLPATVLVLTLCAPLVRLLFERGAFGAEATGATVYALWYLGLGMTGICLLELLNRSFYANHDMWTPVKISVVVMLVNVALNLVLVEKLQQGGLALSVSLSSSLGAALLFRQLLRKVGPVTGGWQAGKSIAKMMAAALIMAIQVHLTYAWLTAVAVHTGYHHQSTTAILLMTVVSGSFTYLYAAYLLGCEEAAIVKTVYKVIVPGVSK